MPKGPKGQKRPADVVGRGGMIGTMSSIHQEQADKNFAALRKLLPTLHAHLNKFALMRDGEIVAIYDTMEDALTTATRFYEDGIFSVQKITAEPVDLGFRSRAGSVQGPDRGGCFSKKVADMLAPYPTKAVANAFLHKGVADRRPIDPMKIQKLVYFAHGYYLAASGNHKPLINEYFEAWPFGPVAPSLYHEFHGSGPILRLATHYSRQFRSHVAVPPPSDDPLFDSVLVYVWATYGGMPSVRLSRLTHAKDGPWDRARGEADGLIGKDIPNAYIEEYFRPLVRRSDGPAAKREISN